MTLPTEQRLSSKTLIWSGIFKLVASEIYMRRVYKNEREKIARAEIVEKTGVSERTSPQSHTSTSPQRV